MPPKTVAQIDNPNDEVKLEFGREHDRLTTAAAKDLTDKCADSRKPK